jgi:hypothetical protein
MLRNLDVFAESLAGCGLAVAIFVLCGSAHAKGAENVLHRAKTMPAASNEKILYAF